MNYFSTHITFKEKNTNINTSPSPQVNNGLLTVGVLAAEF